jgi:hypothetical protein
MTRVEFVGVQEQRLTRQERVMERLSKGQSLSTRTRIESGRSVITVWLGFQEDERTVSMGLTFSDLVNLIRSS